MSPLPLMLAALVAFAPLAVLAQARPPAPAPAPAPQAAPSGPLPAAVVAVLDSQRVTREAKAFVSARQQAEQFGRQLQQEVQREEERLRNEEQELLKQRGVITPDAFEKRRRDFERKVSDWQGRVQDRRRGIEQSLATVRNDINKVVIEVMAGLSRDRGFNLVLDRAQVSFHTDGLDVTGDVIRLLDQRLTTVRVPPPKTN